MNMHRGIVYASAATTAIAGILHLTLAAATMGPSINTGIFFLVSGIAQIFWILPMIRRWGRLWYYTGIVGTSALIILYVITRVPNPITERAIPINEIGIATELLQAAFIGLTIIIIISTRRH